MRYAYVNPKTRRVEYLVNTSRKLDRSELIEVSDPDVQVGDYFIGGKFLKLHEIEPTSIPAEDLKVFLELKGIVLV